MATIRGCLCSYGESQYSCVKHKSLFPLHCMSAENWFRLFRTFTKGVRFLVISYVLVGSTTVVSLQFWAAYIGCGSQYKDSLKQTLEQIDVIRRMVSWYPEDLQFADSSQGWQYSIIVNHYERRPWYSGNLRTLILTGGKSMTPKASITLSPNKTVLSIEGLRA